MSDPDSPAPKPAKSSKPKATMQPKPSVQQPKPATAKSSKSSSQPETTTAKSSKSSSHPKPTPAKPKEKKRKLDAEISKAPSPGKRLKVAKVFKKRKTKSPLKLVDEFVDEGVPVKEPVFEDEDPALQAALEQSLKDQETQARVPLPLFTIREPVPEKPKPLPEVQGKGKKRLVRNKLHTCYLTS